MAAKLIFVSKSNMETARKLKIGRTEQYLLIRSGVPLERIRSASRRSNVSRLEDELKIEPINKLITTIGPFKPQKNLLHFLEAASILHKRYKYVHFLLVGDGALRPDLEKRTRELGLQHNVSMPGWRQDVPEILGMSDVFAMTSLWEGLPRSLVEALAIGVPSVCYDTDGVRDLLESGEGGYIVRQGDVTALADRIGEILEKKDLRDRLAEKARNRIGIEFDIDYMVKQQENLYEDLHFARLRPLDNSRRIN